MDDFHASFFAYLLTLKNIVTLCVNKTIFLALKEKAL